MKQKSCPFKNFVKMNKRDFVTHYLQHLMPHYCIEAQHISGVQEGLDMDRQDPYEGTDNWKEGRNPFFKKTNSHVIQSIP